MKPLVPTALSAIVLTVTASELAVRPTRRLAVVHQRLRNPISNHQQRWKLQKRIPAVGLLSSPSRQQHPRFLRVLHPSPPKESDETHEPLTEVAPMKAGPKNKEAHGSEHRAPQSN